MQTDVEANFTVMHQSSQTVAFHQRLHLSSGMGNNFTVTLPKFTLLGSEFYEVKLAAETLHLDVAQQGADVKTVKGRSSQLTLLSVTNSSIQSAGQDIILKFRAIDPDVADPAQAEAGISYNWSCINMHTGQKCASHADGSALALPAAGQITIPKNTLQAGFLYCFQAKAVKDSRARSGEIYNLLTNLTVSSSVFQPNFNQPDFELNFD